MGVTIGVLALQGDFALHLKSLDAIGIRALQVRGCRELEACDGVILPGGESTTFLKLMRESSLFNALKRFSLKKPVMGTCAGLIVLAETVLNDGFETLKLIDVEVQRNAYGRQIHSFMEKIEIPLFNENPLFEGVFIRAPKILRMDEKIQALGFLGNEVVMARNASILVTTFHPELTPDTRIHRYFVERMVNTG